MQIHRIQNNNTTFQMKYPIRRTKNVSPEFVQEVENCLDSLPDNWQPILQRNYYDLFCSESIPDVYEYYSLNEKADEEDNLEAATFNHPFYKFFVFTPKIKKEDMQRVINHEISHGIVNCAKLPKRFEYMGEIIEDALKFPSKIPNRNPYDITNLLAKYIDEYRANEIFADMIAWAQKGGGLWGSGYKGSQKNPDFLKENYPLTYAKIQEFLNSKEPLEESDLFKRSQDTCPWEDDDDTPF